MLRTTRCPLVTDARCETDPAKYRGHVSGLVYIGVTFLLIGVAVVTHEAGHFVVARRVGIDVEEFAFGFGPRLLSRMAGTTRWSLRLLPVGGSVRFVDGAQSGGYDAATPLQRAKVAAAGPAVNLFFAWAGLTVAAGVLTGRWLLAPVAGLVVLASTVPLFVDAVVSTLLGVHKLATPFSMPASLHHGAIAASAHGGIGLPVYLLLAFAVVHLSLGVINLLPLAPLDGWQLVTAGVQASRDRRASRSGQLSFRDGWLRTAEAVGVGVFSLLCMGALSNDLVRFVSR